jgi:hypothetical protein
VGVIGESYLVELLIAPPSWSAVMFHTVVPRLDDGDAARAVGHERPFRKDMPMEFTDTARL